MVYHPHIPLSPHVRMSRPHAGPSASAYVYQWERSPRVLPFRGLPTSTPLDAHRRRASWHLALPNHTEGRHMPGTTSLTSTPCRRTHERTIHGELPSPKDAKLRVGKATGMSSC